ncbi:hypothetical protein BSL78_29565 [Apostichopus japonicus]|uniref:Protein DD3-3 n=1 Tax=Stichopus japonicus TaxID=307972 RepID=A0A2G8JCZ2_STIJA|nr:hypothetical protein BSL78_29565 [Apostichopus japonicus]
MRCNRSVRHHHLIPENTHTAIATIGNETLVYSQYIYSCGQYPQHSIQTKQRWTSQVQLKITRGSNNRLAEAGRERNNGNRLFDSQNNNRGGYNVGGLYYYTDSMLQIEWTNQHSCGNPNNHCELVVQYMCGDLLRDGAVTSTIPENPSNCDNYDCNTDMEFGMHENFDYYLGCKLRQRNEGLFTADQNLKGNTARFTRQNPQGTRRGYECAEERDYYPYWHPSPWVKLPPTFFVVQYRSILPHVGRCNHDQRRHKVPVYQAESQNVKSRFYCKVPTQLIREKMLTNQPVIPNNQADCEALVYPEGAANGTKGIWMEAKAHGVAAPDCREAHFSRDNHLGNGLNGNPNVYNWTIPSDFVHERCALRMRYNISTGEFDGWDGTTNSSLNAEKNNQPTKLDLSERFGLTPEEAEERGSHSFEIRSRPAELKNQTIHNLNVRGREATSFRFTRPSNTTLYRTPSS